MPKANVVVIEQGYVIQTEDHKGMVLYVGRDGYWTRIRQAASPFKSRVAAQDAANDLNGESKSER